MYIITKSSKNKTKIFVKMTTKRSVENAAIVKKTTKSINRTKLLEKSNL